MRDMTVKQFRAALKARGMKETGVMGYVTGPEEGPTKGLHVCKYNAGGNRRAQLAYLIAEFRKAAERAAQTAKEMAAQRISAPKEEEPKRKGQGS